MLLLNRILPELKKSTYRDRGVSSTEHWLATKRLKDGAEGLWRIHDKLYDLQKFMNDHPGGSVWLELTKGTDITEAFESHHMTNQATETAAKYFVKNTTTPRNSPYTFHEGGFYSRLKKRVNKTLSALHQKPLENRSNILADVLFLTTILLTIMAGYWNSYVVATLAGCFLVYTVAFSHNFYHKKDNWRMYYFGLAFMSTREWRISHVLSHHGYTNSPLELSYVRNKPIRFIPDIQKSWTERYLSMVIWTINHMIHYQLESISRIPYEASSKPDRLGLIIPALIFIANGGYVFLTIMMWSWILFLGTLAYVINQINVAHNHPNRFEVPGPKVDWGLAQLDASTKLGKRITVHTLHHLFPRVDDSILEYLIPNLMETCKEFDIDVIKSSYSYIPN